jgi:uncharacterized protein (DUF342 family)
MIEYPGLAFSEDGKRLVASIRPPADPPPLDLYSLRALLAQSGFGNWLLNEEALVALIQRYNASVAAPELPVGECSDASFKLEITADAMQAWLSVVPACGGKSLEPDDIYLALGESGVTFGIDQAAVVAACAASETGRFMVAAGLPAENGENARFELLVSDARDRAPQLDEHGLVDFHELGAIPTVAAEQPLMRRIPPTNGKAGRNVRGEDIAPVPGHNEPFVENLIGAYVAHDDVNLLRAVFAGQPVRCGNGVSVEEVLRVRNVNMATGNISFDGTVHIDGEVLPGMKVRAKGDIIVGDVVDGAELDAGGDIHVSGGIIAKAHIQAGGSVSARFVENAQISAGTTIAIDDTALQSDLQANNQIIVGLKSAQRGRLAGGSARAMMLIQTPILGSPTGGVTSLMLGVNPVLVAKHQELLQKIEKQKEEEANLEKLVKHLSTHGDKAGMLGRAKASWQQAVQAWGKLLPEREALEKQLAMIEEARVEVGVSAAGAVDMTFGKKVLHLRNNYESGAFSMDGDRIVFTDLSGNVKPAG